jgi:hypothetical protein
MIGVERDSFARPQLSIAGAKLPIARGKLVIERNDARIGDAEAFVTTPEDPTAPKESRSERRTLSIALVLLLTTREPLEAAVRAFL